MSAREGMTAGDLRAEADRIAKARGPAFAEGYQAGLRRAIAIIEAGRREMPPLDFICSEVASDVLVAAIDAIGEEMTAEASGAHR